jgi:hypothetical protein
MGHLRATNIMRVLVVVVTALTPLSGASAGSMPLPESASFYVGNMEQTWSDLVLVAQLMAFCRDRFPQECGPRVAASVPNLDDANDVLKLVTVFGRSATVAAADFPHQYASAPEIYAAGARVRTRFMEEQLEFDKELFAKVGAVDKACPDERSDKTARFLTNASGAEFMRYWGKSLSEYSSLMEDINRKGLGYYRQIKRGWTNERCVKTRAFGRSLLSALKDKVVLYVGDDWYHYTANEKFGQGAAYTAEMAVLFEAQVHPDVVDKVSKSKLGQLGPAEPPK